MSRQYKPRAYLERVRNGYFMTSYCYMWVARDTWGNWVASGRTRKDCESETRRAGYVPELA